MPAHPATLIVGPSWVGDMVMAQALFKLLNVREPRVPLDVVAPQWSLPIIRRMPEVRQRIVSPAAHKELALGKRRELGRKLQSECYAQAIVLPRSLKAALVPWFARIPRRTGFRGEMRYGLINDMRRLDERRFDQTIKRFVALGLSPDEPLPRIPQPELTVSREKQQASIARLQLETDKPVIAMMPGAEYGPAKCWPLDHFRTLAGMLSGSGFDVWVMGSAKDRPAGEVVAGGGRAVNICGLTGLEEVIDLLGYCRQAVSNDSGLMHVAAAVGTRIIGIYGSTTPAFTPPQTADRTLHYSGLACSPCFNRQCPLGHLHCLRGITPDAVFASLTGDRVTGTCHTAPATGA